MIAKNIVNPYDVKGKVNYDRLIKEFGFKSNKGVY